MLGLLVGFARRARAAIRAGVTLAEIRELRCVEQLIRLKGTVANDDAAGLDAAAEAVNRAFGEFERRFS